MNAGGQAGEKHLESRQRGDEEHGNGRKVSRKWWVPRSGSQIEGKVRRDLKDKVDADAPQGRQAVFLMQVWRYKPGHLEPGKQVSGRSEMGCVKTGVSQQDVPACSTSSGSQLLL